jgi:hypothetical protein
MNSLLGHELCTKNGAQYLLLSQNWASKMLKYGEKGNKTVTQVLQGLEAISRPVCETCPRSDAL